MFVGRKLLYWIARGEIWALCKLVFRLHVEGSRSVPRRGGVLICSNHVSHLDPPVVGVAVPRMVFHMAKRELFKVPPLAWWMRTIGTIMVHRGQGRQAINDAVDYLRRGRAVIIFPEGTRSKNGVLMKGHSGAIVIAIAADCPIVPTVIIGSEKAMTKGSKAIKPVPVTVRFGDPYTIAYSGDRSHIPKDVLERELVRLMERIEALLPEHMKPSADDKQAWYAKTAEI
ncbi:MAG: 1-acyl-sn-glycerol-3-phosphate acyltransferase [bacterium]|nr:1-acyl-sn-glycerol-3-phosphate acyltransferase [bacterium]